MAAYTVGELIADLQKMRQDLPLGDEDGGLLIHVEESEYTDDTGQHGYVNLEFSDE